MSLFITFEGIEGSGKSTQISLLDNFLKTRGYKTVLTREPGGTPIGEDIRKILLSSENKSMTPLCELLLYSAGRAQHLSEIIRPALTAGKIVLCDRFADATIAYQGYGRGFPLELVKRTNNLTAGELAPDLTFLADCSPETGLARARKRNADEKNLNLDRFENESMEFHKKVRGGYLAIARNEPKRVVVIDSARDVESVHNEVAKHVLKRLGIYT